MISHPADELGAQGSLTVPMPTILNFTENGDSLMYHHYSACAASRDPVES
jgi:hypothetical protein